MQFLGDFNSRPIYYVKYSSINSAIKEIKLNQGYTVICLFVDDFDFFDNEWNEFIRILLENGGRYFCVHGNNCSHLHDMVDLSCIEMKLEEKDDSVIMTTWHEDEHEKDVIEFALLAAVPDDKYYDNWKAIHFIEFTKNTESTEVEHCLRQHIDLEKKREKIS